MDALSIMKTVDNSSPIHRSSRVAAVWGRCALAALLPLAVMQPALAQSKVLDADLEIAAPSAGQRLDIKNFVFSNNILVDQDALTKAMAKWTGRDLGTAEMEQAAAAVAEHLRSQGHTQVKVSLANERGSVRVRVDGLKPTAKAYAKVKSVEPVVDVKSIAVDGVTQVSAEELQAAVQPWVGKALTMAQLQKPADAVTALLKSKGLSLAQAFVPVQNLQSGQLRVQVVEGKLDGSAGVSGVVVKGVKRTKNAVVARTIAPGAVPNAPLRAAELEKRLILANELPGLKLKGSLVPGSKFGTTVVEVEAEQELSKTINLSIDNHGNRYTGQTRMSADVDFYSPTGNGDQITVGGTTSKDAGSVKMAWSVPIENRDVRIGASFAASQSNMAPQNVNVRFDGQSQQFSLFGQLPLVRRTDASVTAMLSVDNKKLRNEFEDMLFDKREVNSMSLGFNGSFLSADRLGQSRWSTTMSVGETRVLNRLESLNPRLDTHGRFAKVVADYRVSRPLATTGEAGQWTWNARTSGQLHVRGANLDNAEKFQLGGPDGVRGYPVGEGSGDTGILGSLELSRPFKLDRVHASRFFMFVDTGSITRNPHAASSAEASDGMPNTYSLSSAGMGLKLDFTPTTLMQFAIATPWGKNPAQVNNLNSDGRGASQTRLWITLNGRY